MIFGLFNSLGTQNAVAAMRAQQAAIDAQNQLYAMYRTRYMPLSGLTKRPTTRRGKCDSCGSSEFRERGGQTVCSYCRGAA